MAAAAPAEREHCASPGGDSAASPRDAGVQQCEARPPPGAVDRLAWFRCVFVHGSPSRALPSMDGAVGRCDALLHEFLERGGPTLQQVALTVAQQQRERQTPGLESNTRKAPTAAGAASIIASNAAALDFAEASAERGERLSVESVAVISALVLGAPVDKLHAAWASAGASAGAGASARSAGVSRGPAAPPSAALPGASGSPAESPYAQWSRLPSPELVPVYLEFLHSVHGEDPSLLGLRRGLVRCGRQVFCRPEDVHEHLVQLVNGVNGLLESKHNAYAVAAGALLGLLNVHPWRDGNGRVARILASYVLRRAGVPFSVALTASTEHRRAYVAALRECVYASSPTVTPMADLIAEHAARVWDALERARVGANAVAEASSEAASKAVREARQAALDAGCIICMDERPNISMLCCGAAVHLNCMVTWLTEAQCANREPTCVQCRGKLQNFEIVARAPPHPAQQQQDNNNEDDTSTAETDEEEDEDDTTSAVSDDADESSTESVQEESDRHCHFCRRNQRATSCVNAACRECCNSHFMAHCDRHAGT